MACDLMFSNISDICFLAKIRITDDYSPKGNNMFSIRTVALTGSSTPPNSSSQHDYYLLLDAMQSPTTYLLSQTCPSATFWTLLPPSGFFIKLFAATTTGSLNVIFSRWKKDPEMLGLKLFTSAFPRLSFLSPRFYHFFIEITTSYSK